MREALIALNQITADGVVGGYAIGGAIGAAFYIEAVNTQDVDAFVFLNAQAAPFVILTPIYEALASQGGVIEREYVRFGKWPLQILTDANALIAEAITTAITLNYQDVHVRVFRPEYLCAIALQTGRIKDFLRVRMFLEQSAVDRSKLEELVTCFALGEQWKRVQDVG